MITICLTYFRSLSLANLRAALHSVRRQDLSRVAELIVVDNNTDDPAERIQAAIDAEAFPIPARLLSFKHGDPLKTHPWSANVAVREARTDWVLFTRADYILDFGLAQRCLDALDRSPADADFFLTGYVCHMGVDIGECEKTAWRAGGTRTLLDLPCKVEDYTEIDAGVWFLRRDAFERVGGLDEGLHAWGHAQTHFQWKLHSTGTAFTRIERPMFYHPLHSAPRDIGVAHAQLADRGIDLRQLWARYTGTQPY